MQRVMVGGQKYDRRFGEESCGSECRILCVEGQRVVSPRVVGWNVGCEGKLEG